MTYIDPRFRIALEAQRQAPAAPPPRQPPRVVYTPPAPTAANSRPITPMTSSGRRSTPTRSSRGREVASVNPSTGATTTRARAQALPTPDPHARSWVQRDVTDPVDDWLDQWVFGTPGRARERRETGASYNLGDVGQDLYGAFNASLPKLLTALQWASALVKPGPDVDAGNVQPRETPTQAWERQQMEKEGVLRAPGKAPVTSAHNRGLAGRRSA